MNKSELIAAVAEKAGTSQTDAKKTLDAVIDVITEQLRSGDDVTLVGFGSFRATDRPERPGRNPSTGETITIAAARVASFRAGKGLKDAVNIYK